MSQTVDVFFFNVIHCFKLILKKGVSSYFDIAFVLLLLYLNIPLTATTLQLIAALCRRQIVSPLPFSQDNILLCPTQHTCITMSVVIEMTDHLMWQTENESVVEINACKSIISVLNSVTPQLTEVHKGCIEF